MSENIGELTIEQINERLGAIVGEFAALELSIDSDEETIIKGEELAAESKTLREEFASRKSRADRAAAVAEQFAQSEAVEEPEDEAESEAEEEVEEQVAEEAPEPVAAAATPRPKSPARRAAANAPKQQIPDRRPTAVIAATADVPGFSAGEGLSWEDVGRAIDRRITTFNASQYAAAAKAGRHLREQHSVVAIRKPVDSDLLIQNSDPGHVSEVLKRATDEARLPGGSLVASGGWCAPSETLYTLFEMESRDGLYSLPEVGVSRGGINFTPGPDFATIYAGAPGWHYTEQQDIDGTYAVDAGGVGTGAAGTKPCYKVDCPDFTEERLEVDGVCVQAGLLMSRGYPEVIARTTRGVLIAHDHRIAARTVAQVVAGSTAVTMTTDQAGAVAPLLDAIELQVEHYRYVHRLSRGSTLEAVFPFWVRGALRSDLARRLGVDLIDVPNARLDGWFRSRGVSPQFIYNYQDITGAATAFKAWPTSVQFLLYAAGTWVRGVSDIISLDTIYDSTLLETNDYTALWTEEGSLVAKVGHDSRAVTVDICPSGATHLGLDIGCDGTGAPVTP